MPGLILSFVLRRVQQEKEVQATSASSKQRNVAPTKVPRRSVYSLYAAIASFRGGLAFLVPSKTFRRSRSFALLAGVSKEDTQSKIVPIPFVSGFLGTGKTLDNKENGENDSASINIDSQLVANQSPGGGTSMK
jgi:hypothetical protein